MLAESKPFRRGKLDETYFWRSLSNGPGKQLTPRYNTGEMEKAAQGRGTANHDMYTTEAT